MKITSKFYVRRMLLAIVLTFTVGVNVYAYDSDWKSVYSQDFSGVADSSLSESMITERKSTFSAEVKNSALELKSDSICYYRLEDTANLNGSSNAHGIKLQYQSDRIVRELETPIVFEGVQYNHIAKGNNSICIDSAGGKNAFKQFTYINEDKWGSSELAKDVLRTNATRFIVDSSLFESTDNKLTVELVYYTEDAEDNWCNIFYIAPGYPYGKEAKAYDSTTLAADGTGAWKSVKMELSDVDFTQKMAEGNSIRVESTPGKINYFYSVAVYRTEDMVSAEASVNNTVEKKISDEAIYGNTKLTYDMTIPSDVDFTADCKYNSGHNMMSVSLMDGGKTEAATLLYDISDGTAKIYALSSDSGGAVQQNLVYDGDIADKELTYAITVSMKERTYSAEIFEGDSVVGQTASPIAIKNQNSIEGSCRIQYLNIKHNPYSRALLSKFDNFDVSVQEDINYKNCISDANAIVLDVPSDNVVTDDFALPTLGSLHSSAIEWFSSDSSAIAVVDGGSRAKVTRSAAGDVSVTLTAEVTYEDYVLEKQFDITVKSLAGTYMSTENAEITTAPDGTVTADITLKNPGTAGAAQITFAVFSVDPATGDIRDRKTDSKAVTSTYGDLSFHISGLQRESGDKIVYHLWDENNISLVNNAPTKVSGLTLENKVKSINLSWDESYDDNNALDYYAVYRDGVLIAKCTDRQYKDRGASYLEKHSYSVVPVDTNELCGGEDTGEGCTVSMPYYLIPVGKTEVSINSNGFGINMAYRDDPARAAYTEYAEVTDASGETTVCRYIPNNRYIGFYTDKSKINLKELAIDITYLDREGKLIFQYNSVIPEGAQDGIEYALKEIDCGEMTNTNTWKTLSIKIDDAQFRESLLMSGSDFCLLTRDGSGFYVKKAELVEAALYD